MLLCLLITLGYMFAGRLGASPPERLVGDGPPDCVWAEHRDAGLLPGSALHTPPTLVCLSPREVAALGPLDAVTGAAGAWHRLPGGMLPRTRWALGLPLPLNCADADTLAMVPNISRRAAAAVVAARTQRGPLRNESDLRRVPHVGRKTAARLLAAGTLDARCPANWPSASLSATGGPVLRPFLVELLRFLPQSAISRAWGWLARVRRPRVFVAWLKQTFVTANGLDMSESAEPIESFATLEDMFVRTLRPGLREVDPDVRTLVSPVDGRVGATGIITDGTLFQIKGRRYTLAGLLDEPENARHFEGGAYLTLYLAPRDYHRIHSPAAAHVTAARLVPGALMPVFPEALARVDELFSRNERIVTYLRGIDAGGLALVAVGATLVGRIRVNYDERLRGNQGDKRGRSERYAKPIWFERGEELGAFELGSTVVLICQPNKVLLDPLEEGQPIKMGQRIGLSQKAPRGRDVGGAPEFLRPAGDNE